MISPAAGGAAPPDPDDVMLGQIEELKAQAERLLELLRKLTGHTWTAASLPTDPPPAWSEEAVLRLREYQHVNVQLVCQRSQWESRRLSSFLQGIDSPNGASQRDISWWLNRY